MEERYSICCKPGACYKPNMRAIVGGYQRGVLADQAQHEPCKKDQRPIFLLYVPEDALLRNDSSHDPKGLRNYPTITGREDTKFKQVFSIQ